MKQFILVLFLTFITVQYIIPQEISLVNTLNVHLNSKEDNLLKKIKARPSSSKVMLFWLSRSYRDKSKITELSVTSKEITIIKIKKYLFFD
jgi:hypothetical protein